MSEDVHDPATKVASLRSLLMNWRFTEAVDLADKINTLAKGANCGEPISPLHLRQIKALADVFGNGGWLTGGMGMIVVLALGSLMRGLDEPPALAKDGE